MKYESYKKDVLKSLTKAEKNALEAIGFFVEAEAKLRTPVKTGTLKRSITNKVNESDKSVDIGTNIDYASYVELGTSKQKSQPYLTPAVEENKSKITDIVKKHLEKIR